MSMKLIKETVRNSSVEFLIFNLYSIKGVENFWTKMEEIQIEKKRIRITGIKKGSLIIEGIMPRKLSPIVK